MGVPSAPLPPQGFLTRQGRDCTSGGCRQKGPRTTGGLPRMHASKHTRPPSIVFLRRALGRRPTRPRRPAPPPGSPLLRGALTNSRFWRPAIQGPLGDLLITPYHTPPMNPPSREPPRGPTPRRTRGRRPGRRRQRDSLWGPFSLFRRRRRAARARAPPSSPASSFPFSSKSCGLRGERSGLLLPLSNGSSFFSVLRPHKNHSAGAASAPPGRGTD